MNKLKAFYEKHQKAIVMFAIFAIVCLVAGTIYHGDVGNITTN